MMLVTPEDVLGVGDRIVKVVEVEWFDVVEQSRKRQERLGNSSTCHFADDA